MLERTKFNPDIQSFARPPELRRPVDQLLANLAPGSLPQGTEMLENQITRSVIARMSKQ